MYLVKEIRRPFEPAGTCMEGLGRRFVSAEFCKSMTIGEFAPLDQGERESGWTYQPDSNQS